MERRSRKEKTDKRKEPDSILYRQEVTTTIILKRFLNMAVAATEPISETATLEKAAANRMTMETETAALVQEIENLLTINREIKALWIRGPIRKPGEGQGREEQLERQTDVLEKMYNDVVVMRERHLKQKAEALANGTVKGKETTA